MSIDPRALWSSNLCGKCVYVSGFSEGKIHNSFYHIFRAFSTRMCRDVCKRIGFLVGMEKTWKERFGEKF